MMLASQAVPLRDMKNARDNMMGRKEWLKDSIRENTARSNKRSQKPHDSLCSTAVYRIHKQTFKS